MKRRTTAGLVTMCLLALMGCGGATQPNSPSRASETRGGEATGSTGNEPQEPGEAPSPEAEAGALDRARFESSPELSSILRPLELSPAQAGVGQTTLRLVQARGGSKERVLGVLPNGVVLAATLMPNSVYEGGEIMEGFEDPCDLTDVVAVRGQEIIGAVEGICADGERASLLHGDVDGDGVDEFAIRSGHTEFEIVDDWESAQSEVIGHSIRVVILDQAWNERGRYLEQEVLNPAPDTLRMARRIAVAQLDDDDRMDLLVWRRSLTEGCTDGSDIWSFEAGGDAACEPEDSFETSRMSDDGSWAIN